jgi:anaerobic selenocysteine-containing dehydrogenase
MDGGKPVKIEGDPSHPISKGRLCAKGLVSLEYFNHPDRLLHPLKRMGEKGKGKWEEISWNEALDITAEGLSHAKEKYGALSVVFMRGATKGLADDFFARFANVFGSPNISSPAPVCFVPGVKASQLTYGYYAYPDYTFPPKCIVLWGSNPGATCIPSHDEILHALKGGAKLIVIDPVKNENEITERADVWIRLRPGTDLALALGMMNAIINDKLYDSDFVKNWAVGFEKLKTHLQDYSPEKVEEITWVPAKEILRAARLYATETPGCIRWGNGIETDINSFQTCRAIAILRSLTGNLGIPGGELMWSEPGGYRNLGGLTRGSPEFLCQNNISPDVRSKRLSIKDNLMPILYYALPQRIVKAILEEDPYPLRAGYLQGGNLLTSYTNAKATYRALKKLDFFAVADIFMTPTAMLADIVLPVATYFEVDSIEQPWDIPIAAIQQKVTEVGESWPDGKILNELAKKLGMKEYVWDDLREPLDWVLKPAGVTFDEFRKIGALVGTKLYRHFEKKGFNTPSKKVELYSKQLEEWGFDPLPTYREPPESPYSQPELAEEFPLILTSKKEDIYRHSGGRQISSLREKKPDPILKIYHKTAGKLGIKDEDWVNISTKRGKIRQKAKLVDWIDPRVVEVDYAWWFPEKGPTSLFGWEESNINILTDDKPPYNLEMGSANMRGIFCRISKADD